jgi:DNA mismatch repair protein MutS2
MQDQVDHRAFEAAQKQMREGLSGMEDLLKPADDARRPHREPPANLRRGDRVFIHSLNQTGTVSTPPDASGEVQIQAGIMKIKVHVSDLSLDETEEKAKINQYAKSVKAGKSLHLSPEIDMRGMLVDEALEASEKYLDDAYLAGLTNVTLIHGKGTGALRKAIHTLLKKHPHVKAYRLGKYGEGEDGVTVVTLK